MKQIVISLILFLFGASYLFAQDFEVAPVSMFFVVDDGGSETKKLGIVNHSSTAQDFQIIKKDFVVDIHGKTQVMEANSTEKSCNRWLVLEKSFFRLKPNEKILIDVTMKVPLNDNATRWSMLYVQTSQERTSFDVDIDKFSSGILISGSIGVKIFRIPKKPPLPVVKIQNLREVSQPENKNRVFKVDILNEGVTISNCKIFYTLLDMVDAEVYEHNAGNVNVYPGAVREFTFELSPDIKPGRYSLTAVVDFGDKNILEATRFGKELVIKPKGE